MEILVARVRFYDNRTIGQVYIDGELFCFSLEDKVREVAGQPVEQWKIKGETAIPQGKYKVVLENSPKFGADTMTLLNVPGFKYIRIHAGNTEKDTEGCIILGYKLTETGTIVPGTTRTMVNELKGKVRKALDRKEDVWITISNVKT